MSRGSVLPMGLITPANEVLDARAAIKKKCAVAPVCELIMPVSPATREAEGAS